MHYIKKILVLSFGIAPMVVFALPLLVIAADCAAGAGGFVPLACVGDQSTKLSGLYNSADLSTYVNRVFTFAIAIGAMAAVLRLVFAGYLYMAQSDMWSSKGQARMIIADVTLGLLLLLSVWLILNQINPDIVSLNSLKVIQPIPQIQP
ncbi:MAG: hypothetical protein U1D26_02655 [Patescibacteria group bacterium]|nr:hypothetical protein [bacterium]MDZ4227358.1 hypothetical protein [Patescibacteria group bacterium]